jgi:hypothetical protein
VLQPSPSLLLVAFGMPQTLEKPQRSTGGPGAPASVVKAWQKTPSRAATGGTLGALLVDVRRAI